MEKTKYETRDTVTRLTVKEDFSKKLPNFQLVRPLSIEQEVQRFVAAGLNLQKIEGLGVYDFSEAQPIDYSLEDPTREPDYDIIDAAVAQRDLALEIQAANAAGTATQSQGGEDSSSKKEDVTNKPNNGERGEAARETSS